MRFSLKCVSLAFVFLCACSDSSISSQTPAENAAIDVQDSVASEPDSTEIRLDTVSRVVDSIGRVVDSTKNLLDSLMEIVKEADKNLDSLEKIVDSQNEVLDSLKKIASDATDSVTAPVDTVPEIPEEPFDEYAEYEDSDARAYRLFAKTDWLNGAFGTSHVKFAFRNESTENLVLMDVVNDSVRVKSLRLGVEVYHPQYSPDGSKLAFSTTFEGSSHDADLYVMDLNADSSLIKLEVDGAAIPRWRVLDNGDTVIVYVSYSGTNENEKWMSSSTWQVPFAGGKFGSPQKLFGRAYNGGVAYDNSFAVTGASFLMTHFAGTPDSENTVLYDGAQVCNVSLARDSSGVFSFLDASGPQGREFTGQKSYDWHEYLFFMDATGVVIDAIKCLYGYVFADTEWLNKSGYLIGVISADVLRSFIVLIDVKNHSVTPVVQTIRSIDVWQPDMWIEP